MQVLGSKHFLWLALTVFGLFFFPTLYNVGISGDFKQFYFTSQQFLHRLNSYDMNAYTGADWYGFPYPPLAFYLTLIPSLFSFVTAVKIWDVVGLAAHAAIVYCWIEMVWEKPVTVERYVPVFLITFSASCIWAHWVHHLIFPVLLFATLAYWHQRKGNSWLAGLFGGLMLVKPHLALIPFIALVLREKSKWRFLSGAGSVVALSAAPYLLGYRPLSDLAGLFQAAQRYQELPYYLDEQGIPAVLHRLLSADLHAGHYIAPANKLVLYLAHGNRSFHLFKLGGFALFVGLYGTFATRINRSMAQPACYAGLLAASLFFNIYTHVYDGVLLLPLMICGVPALMERIAPLERLVVLAMAVNIVATLGMMLSIPFGYASWNPAGLCSLFYLLVLWAAVGRRQESVGGTTLNFQLPSEAMAHD